jgi:hypothetical protein
VERLEARNGPIELAVPWASFSVRPHRCRPKQRPNVGAATPANLTDEQRLEVGQPDVIGPAVSVDLDVVRAAIVSAQDPQPARAWRSTHPTSGLRQFFPELP